MQFTVVLNEYKRIHAGRYGTLTKCQFDTGKAHLNTLGSMMFVSTGYLQFHAWAAVQSVVQGVMCGTN